MKKIKKFLHKIYPTIVMFHILLFTHTPLHSLVLPHICLCIPRPAPPTPYAALAYAYLAPFLLRPTPLLLMHTPPSSSYALRRSCLCIPRPAPPTPYAALAYAYPARLLLRPRPTTQCLATLHLATLRLVNPPTSCSQARRRWGVVKKGRVKKGRVKSNVAA